MPFRRHPVPRIEAAGLDHRENLVHNFIGNGRSAYGLNFWHAVRMAKFDPVFFEHASWSDHQMTEILSLKANLVNIFHQVFSLVW
jgi:hypothetical protein